MKEEQARIPTRTTPRGRSPHIDPVAAGPKPDSLGGSRGNKEARTATKRVVSIGEGEKGVGGDQVVRANHKYDNEREPGYVA